MNFKITAIQAGKNSKIQRSNIYLDGKFAFSLDNEVMLKERLKTGQELSSGEINILTRADNFHRCLNAAFQFLSVRPRSEAETRQRLKRRGFDGEDIEKAVLKLSKMELLNDSAFAEYWKESRDKFRPRSQNVVKSELRRKGVAPEVVQEIAGDIDDMDNAYRAAVKRARTLPTADYRIFHQRLGSYLQRRGFSYGVINNTVKKAWQERTEKSEQIPDLTQQIDAID